MAVVGTLNQDECWEALWEELDVTFHGRNLTWAFPARSAGFVFVSGAWSELNWVDFAAVVYGFGAQEREQLMIDLAILEHAVVRRGWAVRGPQEVFRDPTEAVFKVALTDHIDPRWDTDMRPSYGYADDVGLDLPLAEDATIYSGKATNVALGIHLQAPLGYWLFIHGRSSALDFGLIVHTGIVDPGYRGPMYARMSALNQPVDVAIGDRFAQAILIPAVPQPDVVFVNQLDPSDRGEAGFGSTGQ